MKFRSPALAILVLCSAAGAAPLGPWGESPYSQAAVIAHDLGFNLDAVEQSFAQELETPPITTDIESNDELTADELANTDLDLGSLPPSKSPDVAIMAIGFTFVGMAGMIGRARARKQCPGRRRVARVREMREIIAAR